MLDPTDSRTPLRTRAALDDLARLLLAEQTLQSALQRIVELVQQTMPAGSDVSITLLRGERPETAGFTGELARQLDESQYATGRGPCLEAALGGLVVEIFDGRQETRWPDYLPTFLDRGALSAMAVPVPAAHLAAGLNVYGRVPEAFTDDDLEVLTTFASYAGAVLTNLDALQDARDLADNLTKALEFRSVIEQAKGILIERYKLTAEPAFRMLADASMNTNRKVRDVAEQLVLTGELPPPTGQQGRTVRAKEFHS